MHRLTAALESAIRNAGAKGFFHLFSANILINLFAFGSQLLVVKFLSPAEMADIKTMQSFTGVAAVLAGFGLNAAVLKLCSETRPESERSAIFRQSLILSILPIAVVLIIGVAVAQLKLFSPEQRVNQWMIVFLLTIPATVITSLIMMYLQARKRIKLMATTQTILRIIGLIVIVVASYYFGFSGFVIATVVVAMTALIPLLRMVSSDLRAEKVKAGLDRVWYFARWSLAANLVGSINSYLDILMLNYLVDDRIGMGYYSIATIFILGLNQVTATVQAIATPYFSEYGNNEAQFMRVLRKYQKMLVLVAFGLTLVTMFAVPWFIELIYGDSYAAAGTFFRILAVKYFLWSCYALLGIAIWGIGKMKFSFYSVLAALIISTAVSYWLILDRGLQGAAYAQVVSYALNLIIVTVMTRLALRGHFHRLENSAPIPGELQ